ncbi:MAG: Gfo/Idh/MocA family oxidoreductase [Phycisphaeraceae bacterium]|nr:Gfo/Idh/MocA family oxidoreductase [Phycisphaeraceae bacterium]
MPERAVRVGIIGLGFMGRTHLRAYNAAAADGLPCEVVACCATRPEDWNELISGASSIAGNIEQAGSTRASIDPTRVRFMTDWRAMAADPGIDLVSICTPTDTHAEIAIQMLRSGKHTLIEKPVALSSAKAREVAAAAEEAERQHVLCMPAHCMRFWSGWDWLKARVNDWSLGPLRALTLQRMGSRPGWSRDYYNDPARCGGALFDLHIHDADIVLWLFGPPASVSSAGHVDHIVTRYHYTHRDAPDIVIAEGAWVADGFPFRMRYTAEFERGVVDWDLARPEPLQLSVGGECRAVVMPPVSGYDGEVRHFVEYVARRYSTRNPTRNLRVTADDAVRVCRLLELELESARSGRPMEWRQLE